MKQLFAILCMIPVLAGSLAAAEALVLEVDGDVEVRVTPDDEWMELEEDTIIPVGATISTGFGAGAVVEVGPNARLHIDSLSRLTIDQLIEREGIVESELELSVGRIQGEVQRVDERPTEFQVRSEVATASVRGTSFEFDGVNVRVFEGQVDLANRFNQRVSVSQGERSTTTGDPPSSGDESREADSNVNIYSSGVEERTESTVDGRESDRSTLRLELRAPTGE